MFDPRRLSSFMEACAPAAVCTVVATSGSTPRKAGAAMLVVDDGTAIGSIEGTVGGGAIEHAIRRAAVRAIASGTPTLQEFALTTELGMCCGGQMKVFIEPLADATPLFIFGAGHVGTALAAQAQAAGFRVWVCDPRPDCLRPEALEGANLVDDYDSAALDTLPFGPHAFALVVTHDHPTDQALVERVLNRSFRYLAMIGSKRKATLMRERLDAKGFSAEQISSVRSPAGLNIGAETPGEIACAILAEMIQVRRQQSASATATLVGAQTFIA